MGQACSEDEVKQPISDTCDEERRDSDAASFAVQDEVPLWKMQVDARLDDCAAAEKEKERWEEERKRQAESLQAEVKLPEAADETADASAEIVAKDTKKKPAKKGKSAAPKSKEGRSKAAKENKDQADKNQDQAEKSQDAAEKKGPQREIPSEEAWNAEHLAAWEALSKDEQKSRADEMVEAAQRNDIDALLRLVASGTKVNATDKESRNCLRTAARHGYTDIVEAILKMGGKVNSVNKFSQESPLHYACKFNRRETAVLLAQAGADVTIVNAKGQTAAAMCQDAELAKWLAGKPTETPPPKFS